MPQFLSRVMLHLCNWCKKEVETSMMTEQEDGERICLHCLCHSHPNLKAHISQEELDKLEPR